MARDDLHFRLRIPDALKAKIEEAAAQNKRSMTAEIIARLEEYDALSRSPIKLPRGLFYRVDEAAIRRQRSVYEEVIQALEAAYPAPVANEVDEVATEWYWKYSDATVEEREAVLEQANADLKARGWPHQMWAGQPREDGIPVLHLGIKRFGPLDDN